MFEWFWKGDEDDIIMCSDRGVCKPVTSNFIRDLFKGWFF